MSLDLDEETLAVLVPSWGWFYTGIEAAAAESKHLAQKRLNTASVRRRPKRAESGPCPNCEKEFDHRGSGKGWLRTFCSDTCRARFHDRKRKAAMRKSQDTHCVCGAALMSNPKHKPRKWCSEKCRRNAKREAA